MTRGTNNIVLTFSLLISTFSIIYLYHITNSNFLRYDSIQRRRRENNITFKRKQPTRKQYYGDDGPGISFYSRKINTPTRGEPGSYQDVGFLTNPTTNEVLPLTGRQTYPGSPMWNYYTTTNNFNQVQIPVNNNKSNCQEDRGCSELNSGDVAMVNNEPNNVTMHPYNRLRYIPY